MRFAIVVILYTIKPPLGKDDFGTVIKNSKLFLFDHDFEVLTIEKTRHYSLQTIKLYVRLTIVFSLIMSQYVRA